MHRVTGLVLIAAFCILQLGAVWCPAVDCCDAKTQHSRCSANPAIHEQGCDDQSAACACCFDRAPVLPAAVQPPLVFRETLPAPRDAEPQAPIPPAEDLLKIPKSAVC